jgi:3-oxoacyl-[acyl-carrier-protein] synthase-3
MDGQKIGATITGVSDYSPGPPVSNAELEEVLQVAVSTQMAYFGVEARHFVIDPLTGKRREPDLGTTEMAARAAQEALAQAGVELGEVDWLITASSTPDERLPPLTYKVQRRLGLSSVQMVDLRGGCTVALQALLTACSLIESGRARTVLVTAADCISPHYFAPLLQAKGHISSEDLLNGLAFADGAGAIVVQAKPERRGLRVKHVDVASHFPDRDVGFSLNAYGEASHNHRAIRTVLPKVVARAMDDLLSPVGGDPKEIDVLIVPQVNRSMIGIARTEAMDEKRFYVGHEIGNCPAPAIYRALARAISAGKVTPGESAVGILGIETASWCYGVSLLN